MCEATKKEKMERKDKEKQTHPGFSLCSMHRKKFQCEPSTFLSSMFVPKVPHLLLFIPLCNSLPISVGGAHN
jgi:hypothetical protein